jgi:hypothetical protein
MTTLRIALAQSPLRAATAQAQRQVEVRARLTDLRVTGQQTWTRAARYELLTDGMPQMYGSYAEIAEIASHLSGRQGEPLDWQPCWFPGQ